MVGTGSVGLILGCGQPDPAADPLVLDGGMEPWTSASEDAGDDDTSTGSSNDGSGDSGDSDGGSDDGPPDAPTAPFGRCAEAPPPGASVAPPPPAYSGGVCPGLEPGYNTNFLSQGRQRELALVIPSSYDPAHRYPLVFVWYHLTGNAMDFTDILGAQALADAMQMIFVVPQDTGDFEFVWPDTPLDVAQSQVDLGMFDDVYACLSQQYSINAACVSSAGVSAGGLWTAYLGQQRGQYLASNLAFSGGYPTELGGAWWPWSSSPHTFASLVLWGGPTDQLILDFHAASLNYIDHLRGDGHMVVTCEHTGGHGVPVPDQAGDPPPFEAIFDFILDHPYWDPGGSPYQDSGLPDSFPSYCTAP